MKRFLITLGAAAALSVSAVQYDAVFDDAHMLKPETAAYIRGVGNELYKSGKVQFTVKIVKDCGDTLTDGRKFFNDTGIGDKDKNNGLLLYINAKNFVANKPNKVRLLTGYGMEGMFPDGKCGRILDSALKLPDVDGRVKAVVDAIAVEFKALGDAPVPTKPKPNHKPLIIFIVVVIVLILLDCWFNDGEITSGILCVVSSGGGGGGSSGGGGGFGGGSCGGGGAGR